MKFLSEHPEELVKTRTLRRRVKEEQWDKKSQDPSKENRVNLFLGSTATTFLQQFLTQQECLEEDQADARLGQQAEGLDPPEARAISMPPDRLATQVRSDT